MLSVKGGKMHYMRISILFLAELSLVYFGTHCAAWAKQTPWTPEFMQTTSSTRGPLDPVRIRLAKLPPKTLEFLSLELDEIDVTQMVTMEGDIAVFTPPQPLAYGDHQLRLIENGKDGSISERGQWSFELRKSERFRDSQANGNVIVKGSYRVSEQGISNAPDRLQADGAGQFYGSAENENWHASGALSVIANSQSQIRPFDLGQYLLSADSGLFGVNLGDHSIGPESMVLQSFGRRGLSVSAKTPGNKASVTGFSMFTRNAHGLGVSDSANRVDGIVAMVQPIPGDLDALALMGTYVNGENEGQSWGSSSSGGLASSLIADSNLLQRRLRLRGEYAMSSYDFDGNTGSLAPIDGRAYSGLVTYSPWNDKMIFNQSFQWNMGVEKKLISSYFRSPSNPGTISDRDMTRAFTGVNWYGVDAQINAGRESDNVDNNALIPVTVSQQRSGAIYYSPIVNYALQENGKPPELGWYGQPNFNASFMSLNREFVQLNGNAYNQPTHSTYNTVVGANFQYVLWNWGLMQSWVRDRGYDLDMTPLTLTGSTRLQGNFLLCEQLNFGINAFSDNVDYVNSGIQSNGIGWGINLSYPFTDKISSNLSYSTRRGWQTDGSNDSVTKDITAALNWILSLPRGIAPGVTLGIDGSYHDVSNNSSTTIQPVSAMNSMYQVFIRLNLSWAPGN